MPTPTITQIENAILAVITALELFATVESCGRRVIPDVYVYPACFVYFDGDEAVVDAPRPIDDVKVKVVIQAANQGGEDQSARDIYSLNDAVRLIMRGKTLGMELEPFACESRICSDYNDAEGMIEYTHTYRTRLYQPVPVAD